LSIPHLGEKNALLLARYLQTKMPQAQDATLRIDDLIKLGSSLTVNELAQIKDFGPVITEAIVQWFQDKTNTEFLKN